MIHSDSRARFLFHLSIFFARSCRFNFPLEASAFDCASLRFIPWLWLFHSPSVASFRAIWPSKAFDRVQYYSAAIEISNIFRSSLSNSPLVSQEIFECRESLNKLRDCQKFHSFQNVGSRNCPEMLEIS